MTAAEIVTAVRALIGPGQSTDAFEEAVLRGLGRPPTSEELANFRRASIESGVRELFDTALQAGFLDIKGFTSGGDPNVWVSQEFLDQL